ncbi:MAG: hypothetical protein ACI4AM_09015 [Muribaculaceae bacterium]
MIASGNARPKRECAFADKYGVISCEIKRAFLISFIDFLFVVSNAFCAAYSLATAKLAKIFHLTALINKLHPQINNFKILPPQNLAKTQ